MRNFDDFVSAFSNFIFDAVAFKTHTSANRFFARRNVENDDTRLARLREVGDVAKIVRIELQIYVSRVLFGQPARSRPGGPGEPQMEGGRRRGQNIPK